MEAPDLTYQQQSHLLLDLKGYLEREEEQGDSPQLVRAQAEAGYFVFDRSRDRSATGDCEGGRSRLHRKQSG